MQLVKCSLLSNSDDPDVVEIFKMQTSRKCKFKKKWSANKAAVNMSEQADFNQRFQSQSTKLGLGHGNFTNNPTPAERRKQVSRAFTIAAEEKRLAHAATLSRQGNWTTFKDGVRCFDLSWNNLIYGPGPKVISFVLNSLINSVRTPDMLKLWGYKQSASCPLCDRSPCTIHHILSNCQYALTKDDIIGGMIPSSRISNLRSSPTLAHTTRATCPRRAFQLSRSASFLSRRTQV